MDCRRGRRRWIIGIVLRSQHIMGRRSLAVIIIYVRFRFKTQFLFFFRIQIFSISTLSQLGQTAALSTAFVHKIEVLLVF